MRVYTDDDLRRIDRTWLGPPNKRLPWVATYRQYVTIIIVSLTMFAAMLFLGFNMTELGWQFVCFCLIYFTVKFINANYRDDVGILINGLTAYQELTVPREDLGKRFDKTLRLNMTRHAAQQCCMPDRRGKAILRQRIAASKIRALNDRRVKK